MKLISKIFVKEVGVRLVTIAQILECETHFSKIDEEIH